MLQKKKTLEIFKICSKNSSKFKKKLKKNYFKKFINLEVFKDILH